MRSRAPTASDASTTSRTGSSASSRASCTRRRRRSCCTTSTQRFVTGTVRMRLLKGQAVAVGRRAPQSLYDFNLATYETGDQFDHSAAEHFIKLFSQGLRTQARVQLGAGNTQEIRSLVAPTIDEEP